jgi:chaperone modulatory protein CbpM
MISIDVLVAEMAGLQVPDVQRWIDNDWVRPLGVAGGYLFMEMDVARVRLIRELRDDLDIDEVALPVVLLLDQLHDLRRRMRELGAAIEQATTGETRQAMMLHLSKARAE